MKKMFLILLVLFQITAYSQTVSEMKNNVNKIKFTISPNPLEVSKDKILMKNIKITIPANYFSKDATMTIEAILMYDGDGTSLKSIVLNGENTKNSTNVVKTNQENTFTINLDGLSINYYADQKDKLELAVNFAIKNVTTNESNQTTIIAISPLKIVDNKGNVEEIAQVSSQKSEVTKQTTVIDNSDLNEKIKNTSDANQKIDLYNKLGELEFENQNYENSINAFRLKIELEKTNNMTKELTNDYMILANLYFNSDNYLAAIDNYKNAISYIDSVNDKDLYVEIHNNQGIVYQSIGDYNMALASFEKAYQITKNTSKASQYLYQIANIYTVQASQEKVIEYYNLIIENEKNNSQTKELTASYNNVGAAYVEQKDYDKAEIIFNEALEINKEENLALNATIFNNLGNISFYKLDYEKANEYYLKSIEAKKGNKDSSGISLTYYNIANSYLKLKEIPKAIENYKTSLNYANQIVDNEIISKNYYMLSKVEGEGEQCTNVVDYYKSYINSKYSKNTENEGQISEIQNKYADQIFSSSLKNILTKKDIQIKQLTLQNDNQRINNEKLSLEKQVEKTKNSKLKSILFILGFGFIIFTLLGLMLLRQYTLKKKAYNELILKNEQISTQNEEILSQSEQLKQANEEIVTINEDLFQQKEELQSTLENLKATQKQLIESEKMAGLGQLIAGIAHELNTPLGAIKSSISTVSDSITKTFEELPVLIKNLSDENYLLFIKMINTSLLNDATYSSREERKMKREVESLLESKNVNNANEIATNFADIGLFTNIEEFEILYTHKDREKIFAAAYTLANLNKNSKNIKIAVEGASKIIIALKNYSHNNTEEKTKSNINNGLETVLTIYHNKIKYTTNVEKNLGELPEINCYADELNQVWTNIIVNAIQAMEGTNGKLIINSQHSNNQIVVTIADTGKGIPVEIRDRIFEPFFTTKIAGEGTGLGLDIVKRIIEKHNGTISFESEINKGTTFKITLPTNL